jgi:hypothetical protein
MSDNAKNQALSPSSRKFWGIILGICLFAVFALAAGELFFRREIRFTFVFPGNFGTPPVVEVRMVPRENSLEGNLSRYVEEAILGPAAIEASPLFFPRTGIRSLLLRDGTAYIDLSEDAAVSPSGGPISGNFLILYEGIRRNLPAVKKINFFIEGHEIFFERN